LEQLRDRLERRGGRDRAPTKPAESVSAIAGAAVVVLQGNQTVASGKSDKDGLYRVELEPGMYTVQVSLAGYDTSQQAIRMGNADVTRQVVLTKAAPR
jgi:hypothetical protein